MKELLNKIQKDLKTLQSTIEKEGNDLVNKAKKAVNDIKKNNQVKTRTRELEKLIESKFRKFEPAMYKFIGQVSKNASKYGLDVGDLEKIVRTGVKQAKSRLSGLKGANKTKRSKTSTKKKATKTSSRKTSTKKKPTVSNGATSASSVNTSASTESESSASV